VLIGKFEQALAEAFERSITAGPKFVFVQFVGHEVSSVQQRRGTKQAAKTKTCGRFARRWKSKYKVMASKNGDLAFAAPRRK
jgi:hypothetical protein